MCILLRISNIKSQEYKYTSHSHIFCLFSLEFSLSTFLKLTVLFITSVVKRAGSYSIITVDTVLVSYFDKNSQENNEMRSNKEFN